MLLALFVLSLIAALRGWFPLSLIVFALAYGFTLADFGSITPDTSLTPFGISTTAGSLIEYLVGGTLGAMILFDRA